MDGGVLRSRHAHAGEGSCRRVSEPMQLVRCPPTQIFGGAGSWFPSIHTQSCAAVIPRIASTSSSAMRGRRIAIVKPVAQANDRRWDCAVSRDPSRFRDARVSIWRQHLPPRGVGRRLLKVAGQTPPYAGRRPPTDRRTDTASRFPQQSGFENAHCRSFRLRH